MNRIVIFGNSASGKTTLAKQLSDEFKLVHLDLDTLAWDDTTPPQRSALATTKAKIEGFMKSHEDWVIEGCYADLLEFAIPFSTKVYYLCLPIDLCVANAKKRPWEPHKYKTKEAQDANLQMLIGWIEAYETRDDTFSKVAHMDLFRNYAGPKTMVEDNRHWHDQ